MGDVTAAETAFDATGAANAEVRGVLLRWWDAGHRDLPWRRTSDPYAILVSETMLQQTQVERVVPKYVAFMARFPNLRALAEAATADVIRAWAGLGYNRRAVNLQRLARAVMAEHGGTLPDTAAALQRLPGVGPYTARAVAAIAFERPAAAVDTNVRRVLTRVVDGTEDERTPRQVQALADAMLDAGRPGDWNQALMELGARICTAAVPRCTECPLMRRCAAAPRIRVVRESGARYRAPRRAPAQARYEHSDRFYRGRIVDALRAQEGAAGLPVAEIGRRLRLDFSPADLPWLYALLAGLVRDGLLVWSGAEDEPARLPA